MQITIHIAERIQKSLSTEQIDALSLAFQEYKGKRTVSQYFGRDEGYDWPNSAKETKLRHMHIHPHFLSGLPVTLENNPLKTWRLKSIQFHRGSDTHLIYCQGIRLLNHYKFLAFLKIGAHEYARKVSAIGMLADEAEEFQRKY